MTKCRVVLAAGVAAFALGRPALAEPVQGLSDSGYERPPENDDGRGRYQNEFPLADQDRVPAGYHVEERARKGPLIAGLVIAGVPYVLGLTTLNNANSQNAGFYLIIPVLGPWLTLQQRNSQCDESVDGCVNDLGNGALLTLDGLMQVAGGICVTVGLAATRPWAVRDGGTWNVSVAPQVGPDGHYGLAATGEF